MSFIIIKAQAHPSYQGQLSCPPGHSGGGLASSLPRHLLTCTITICGRTAFAAATCNLLNASSVPVCQARAFRISSLPHTCSRTKRTRLSSVHLTARFLAFASKRHKPHCLYPMLGQLPPPAAINYLSAAESGDSLVPVVSWGPSSSKELSHFRKKESHLQGLTTSEPMNQERLTINYIHPVCHQWGTELPIFGEPPGNAWCISWPIASYGIQTVGTGSASQLITRFCLLAKLIALLGLGFFSHTQPPLQGEFWLLLIKVALMQPSVAPCSGSRAIQDGISLVPLTIPSLWILWSAIRAIGRLHVIRS
ncbi:hypothetical protein CCM_03775 [Cordyceps militaris CM01]|uniref:Uncharacterized protein n=1 Tax=Cordyceps militaris (strain CM01) TaxID=983644 RepID=G3JGI5_CORMM|nr:uncharacterized protein CCM_03775 [Cordyceps militaris CM01]EGX92402.1 hypothetical protein CCM_03775 [Cordyceps militaris CM01]